MEKFLFITAFVISWVKKSTFSSQSYQFSGYNYDKLTF